VGLLIDSSLLIEHERGGLDVRARVRAAKEDTFFLSVVTASELLHGVHRAAAEGIRARRSAFVEAVLESFPLLLIDLPTARAHARLWASLAAAGRPIGPHDQWLAATCLAHGLTLATANLREFERVERASERTWAAEG